MSGHGLTEGKHCRHGDMGDVGWMGGIASDHDVGWGMRRHGNMGGCRMDGWTAVLQIMMMVEGYKLPGNQLVHLAA
eukprot:scaffold196497_cov23-Tisochrysis_lutea.AAC.1